MATKTVTPKNAGIKIFGSKRPYGKAKADQGKTSREFHAAYPIDQIDFRPSDNYRWGSEEGMKADILTGDSASSFTDLVNSIHTLGVEDPVGIDNDGRVVFGFTRVKACLEAGITEVPVFKYAAGLPDFERRLLQMRENSANVRRDVPWSKTAAAAEALFDECQASGDSAKAAWDLTAKALGFSAGRLRKLIDRRNRLHPNLVALADQGLLNLTAAVEFIPDKDGEQYTDEFVDAIIANLPTDKAGNIQPVSAGKAVEVVKAAAEDAPEDAPEDAGAPKGRMTRQRPSAGQVKDTALALALGVLDDAGVFDALDNAGSWKMAPSDMQQALDKEADNIATIGTMLGMQDGLAAAMGEDGDLSNFKALRDQHASQGIITAYLFALLDTEDNMFAGKDGEEVPFSEARLTCTGSDGEKRKAKGGNLISEIAEEVAQADKIGRTKNITLAHRIQEAYTKAIALAEDVDAHMSSED